MPYGVPNGSAISYGAPGFPGWVYQLGSIFGLQASTYPGHQENNRNEPGFAPNPMGLNRGIDWAGSVESMQRFADYCLSIRGQLEQVIWQNPQTGRRVGVAGGQDVSGTGYYGADYAGHQDHVHTRQSEPIPLPGTPPPPPPPADVVTWGIDISNHQGVVDLDRVKAEGFSFVWAKVSEGATFRDTYWPGTRDAARRAGLILAGYHYIREGDAAAQARAFVEHLGDKSIPAMLDFEDGSGRIEQFWAVKDAIEALGVRVRLSYIPDWYWERIGKPDLSTVPGLIASEYVSGTGYASVLYPGNNSPLWKSFGGRTPDILQFTDRATVTGRPMDANAFRGTPDQLRQLLIGGDDDLSADAEQMIRELHAVLFNRNPSQSIYATPGEGARWQLAELVRNGDGMLHALYVEAAARLGDFRELARVALVANGRGANTEPQVIARARQLLAEIEAANPDLLRAFLASQSGAVR